MDKKEPLKLNIFPRTLRFGECPVCRKAMQAGDMKPFKVKPRPAVPGSPRKPGRPGQDAGAAAAGGANAAKSENTAPWRSSTKLRALVKEIDAMKAVRLSW